jgi:UDP-N-acetylmuramoylalanine--D-glutamate ligase
MSLAGKRVLVMGMGRSGQSAARLALSEGATVTVTDLRVDGPAMPGCTQVYGYHDRLDFLEADLIIVSPGVPAAQRDLAAAAEAGVPLTSELGLAAERLQQAGVRLVAVTGTNGKSSVTDFTAQLLRQAGKRVFAGGNLGHPLSEAVPIADSLDVAVVEVSSYQLELPGGLAPHAAVILNLAPDHLGRHKTMENYARTKARIFEKMAPDGLAALTAKDRSGLLDHGQTQARRCWLGRTPGVRIIEDQVHLEGTKDDGQISLVALKLLGKHNRDNAAAAVFLAVAAGAAREALDLSALVALPHRLEPVHHSQGVRWINDSKATNVDAALVGISAIQAPMVVLMGGQGKPGADYGRLRDVLQESARAVVCFGASGPEIAAALRGLPVQHASNLAEAVQTAAGLADSDSVVLLSPACASFDEFEDFEDRGRAFSALAREIQL